VAWESVTNANVCYVFIQFTLWRSLRSKCFFARTHAPPPIVLMLLSMVFHQRRRKEHMCLHISVLTIQLFFRRENIWDQCQRPQKGRRSRGIDHSLTHSWNWALHEKLPIVQLLKKFPAFYVTRRVLTMFTRALHWSISWARSIQSIPSKWSLPPPKILDGCQRKYFVSSQKNPLRGL
jgi:hypothetical protein